ncbi:MAG: hypothetical protein F4140_08030, partial [Cenarchaeum sp. SB0675_bin_21]|nr:hypothetical protein [Cenarchaeum sp. SB0675_bin_21]
MELRNNSTRSAIVITYGEKILFMQKRRTLTMIAMVIVMALATIGFVIGEAEANLVVSPVAAISDGIDGFTALDGADGVAIAEISDRTYAVV